MPSTKGCSAYLNTGSPPAALTAASPILTIDLSILPLSMLWSKETKMSTSFLEGIHVSLAIDPWRLA